MTKEETAKILSIMCISYPNYKPADNAATLSVWNDMLQEFNYSQVSLALKSYIMSDPSGFAPSIGALINIIQKTQQEQPLTDLEAWSLVANAIRNSSYNSIEEFEKLPEIVQRAVGQPTVLRQWALDEKFNEGVAREDFLKVYRIENTRQMEFERMPKQVRQLIDKVNENSLRNAIASKNNSMIKSLTTTKNAPDEAYNGIEMPKEVEEKIKSMFKD